MTNKRGTLIVLLYIRLDKSDDIANQVAMLESYFPRLTVAGTDWDEDKRIAILVSSLSELN